MEACLGVRHTNSMQFVTVEKLQKSPKSRNCRNHQSRETAQIVCNALTSAHACAEVKKNDLNFAAAGKRSNRLAETVQMSNFRHTWAHMHV